jgi:iron(III) transport system ATP-binding protein/putative spermidine/putrescine transport system ATP-binding protein
MTKRYGSVVVVDAIDLAIEEGEFLVLLGPSGCGKTTTLRCIAGLETVSGGTIRFGDTVVSSVDGSVPPEKREIGMVFQSYAVWPHMTVYENVAFGLRLKRGLEKRQIAERVEKALDTVGLTAYAQRGVYQLSGGQQQRVALARAFVLEPRVLLFDEPLSNLDAKLREHMRFELRQLQQRLGITSIYVTHDQDEAMVVADRIALMEGGHIVQTGTPMDIYNRPASVFAANFIGITNAWAGVVNTSGAAGTTVRISDDVVLHSADTGFSVGETVDTMCRPEQFSLSSSRPEGVNVFAATVQDIAFLGNTADVFLAVGGTKLRVQVSPAAHWPAGTPLWIGIRPDAVRLLRKDAARPMASVA